MWTSRKVFAHALFVYISPALFIFAHTFYNFGQNWTLLDGLYQPAVVRDLKIIGHYHHRYIVIIIAIIITVLSSSSSSPSSSPYCHRHHHRHHHNHTAIMIIITPGYLCMGNAGCRSKIPGAIGTTLVKAIGTGLPEYYQEYFLQEYFFNRDYSCQDNQSTFA